MKICCVCGGSVSSRITLKSDSRHSIKVEDPQTGRCTKNKSRSGTHLGEKASENRVVYLKKNKCSIVSLSILKEASRSAPTICKPSSKQSLPSRTSGSHTVDSDTASVGGFWDIVTNIRRSAEIIGLGQARIGNLKGRI
jgi:hypothetical protein